jgi:CheY-like chemotaxis protein
MDRDQFTQVVLNLLRNARDAMPEGGRLQIAVEDIVTHDPDESGADQPHAVLVIGDTGHGMSPEVQKRVFEPLFTTKSRAARRGRGLGMAVVYSAVKNANGFIRILSEPGAGTAVRVFLPVSSEPLTVRESAASPSPVSRGQGTLLLVDDDPLTRDAWTAALESWGYRVLIAESIEDAAPLLQARESSVALAVIDMTSLGGNSLAATERLVASEPNLRVLLTGGLDSAAVPGPLEGRVCGRLAKPFRLEELASAVAGALA